MDARRSLPQARRAEEPGGSGAGGGGQLGRLQQSEVAAPIVVAALRAPCGRYLRPYMASGSNSYAQTS
jgi:hypothetical protein